MLIPPTKWGDEKKKKCVPLFVDHCLRSVLSIQLASLPCAKDYRIVYKQPLAGCLNFCQWCQSHGVGDDIQIIYYTKWMRLILICLVTSKRGKQHNYLRFEIISFALDVFITGECVCVCDFNSFMIHTMWNDSIYNDLIRFRWKHVRIDQLYFFSLSLSSR